MISFLRSFEDPGREYNCDEQEMSVVVFIAIASVWVLIIQVGRSRGSGINRV